MEVYVSINGNQAGPFDEEAVLAHLASGMLSPNDIAFRRGDAAWARLGDMFAEKLPVSSQVSAPQSFSQEPSGSPVSRAFTIWDFLRIMRIVVLILFILNIILILVNGFLSFLHSWANTPH
jgi:uncharacterized protein DUF4339